MIYKTFLILSLTLISCSKSDFTKDECEVLSMKKFKGYHTESHQFDNYCTQYDIKYTQQKCKKALNQLILGARLDKLEKAHGSNIGECFTKNDLKKFGTRE